MGCRAGWHKTGTRQSGRAAQRNRGRNVLIEGIQLSAKLCIVALVSCVAVHALPYVSLGSPHPSLVQGQYTAVVFCHSRGNCYSSTKQMHEYCMAAN